MKMAQLLNSVSASHAYLPETEGPLTRGSRPGRTSGGSVGEVPKCTDLIGRARFGTKTSIRDPTLSLRPGRRRRRVCTGALYYEQPIYTVLRTISVVERKR